MHFYGMRLEDVDGMAYGDAVMLYKSVRVIQSQKALVQMDVADYPHLKRSERRKMHAAYQKQAEIDSAKESYLTTDQFFAMAGGRVNSGQ